MRLTNRNEDEESKIERNSDLFYSLNDQIVEYDNVDPQIVEEGDLDVKKSVYLSPSGGIDYSQSLK